MTDNFADATSFTGVNPNDTASNLTGKVEGNAPSAVLSEGVTYYGNKPGEALQIEKMIAERDAQATSQAQKPTIDITAIADKTNARVMGNFDVEAFKQELINNVKLENARVKAKNEADKLQNPNAVERGMLKTVSAERIAIHLLDNKEVIDHLQKVGIPRENIINAICDLASMDAQSRDEGNGPFVDVVPYTFHSQKLGVERSGGKDDSPENKKEPEIRVEGFFNQVLNKARANAIKTQGSISKLSLLQAMFETGHSRFMDGGVIGTLQNYDITFEKVFKPAFEAFEAEENKFENKMMDKVGKLIKEPLEGMVKKSAEVTGKAIGEQLQPATQALTALHTQQTAMLQNQQKLLIELAQQQRQGFVQREENRQPGLAMSV